MSLDNDLPIKVSPAFPATASLSEQPQLEKPHPWFSDNGHPSLPGPPPGSRFGKRRYSVGVGFKGLAKRRRRANSESESDSVLPTNFLLGGNIFDPLNLNSLLDEDVNRATNQETPKCSPLPSRGGDPVEILVPRDITDPLNLKGGCGVGGEDAGMLLSPVKSRRRHRTRHHGAGGGEKEAVPARLFSSSAGATDSSVPPSPLPCELNTAITCRDDVAPPPVLPRRHTHPPPGHKPGNQSDGRPRKRRRTTSTKSTDTTMVTTTTTAQLSKFQTPLVGGAKKSGDSLVSTRPPEKRKKDKHRYQYGSHSHYYGYHGFYGEGRVGTEEDPRLCLLEDKWFRDKTVLDVGCAAGHMTLSIARRFSPTHILGVELDRQLVHAANQNIRHFLSHDLVVEERGRTRGTVLLTIKGENQDTEILEEEGEQEEKDKKRGHEEVVEEALSLLSFMVTRGPLSAPPLFLPPSSSSRFPNNITFIQGDYVSERVVWPGGGQYDVIMCFGVTKWVQLQSGDAGVVRLFRRAYHSLSPGGLFILEPQPWSSYSHSKRASETTYQNYRSLRLKPEQFTTYLTDCVGFTSYRLLKHTGNLRPVYLFHKGSAQRK
ncbi:7SK snRNA methylphosphate capping enzyme isoform X2 [Betta splendens]|uniref:RNA methyltransferase n=1 Tax=Betta splendens TaxID=158456 RepID=A0A6P7LUD4_BETSP|nr:7SK snRNA methylphosphate capping enzyme isoform X2 [Betta splendens]